MLRLNAHSLFQIVFLLCACYLLVNTDKAVSKSSDTSVIPVKILAISDLVTDEFDSFLARIDATRRAQLSFQVAGEVEKLHVKMGQRVKQGDVLASLDPKDLRLALEAADAEFFLVKSQLSRAKFLFKKKLVSVADYEQLETKHKSALANFEQAKTDLDYTQIQAPFDGIISYSYIKPFEFVNPKQEILNLIDNEKLDVLVTLPVNYVETITLPAFESIDIWVTIDSEPNKRIQGVFKEISTKPDKETNSYLATVSIERAQDRNLLTGMTGQVHIAKPNASQEIFLPKTAWITKDDTHGQVWVMSPETNKVKKITLKLNSTGAVQSGLKRTDLIVVSGVDKLVENQEVKNWVREEGI